MKPNPPTRSPKLSNGFSADRVAALITLGESSRSLLADFLRERFEERYVSPACALSDGNLGAGFSAMALCCLMIEALEQFRFGENQTPGKQQADRFMSFFNRWQCLDTSFATIDAKRFYGNIRCGILHQAETKGGWRVLRSGATVDECSRTINVRKFALTMRSVVAKYTDELRTLDWEGAQWHAFRRKVEYVIDNARFTRVA